MVIVLCFFFKQKTAYEMRISDWSSDVCSSDLTAGRTARAAQRTALLARPADRRDLADGPGQPALRTGAAVGRGDPPAQTAAEPVRAAPGTQPPAVQAGRAQRRRPAQGREGRRVGKECGSTCRYG